MFLVFDPKIVEQLFVTPGEMIATEGIHPEVQPVQRTLWIEYAGTTLKYTICLPHIQHRENGQFFPNQPQAQRQSRLNIRRARNERSSSSTCKLDR